jgi:competence protein ComEC
LLLALVIVLTLDPLAVITGSFWLSFTAVALITWLILGRAWTGPRWRSLLHVQLALALGLAPLSLTLFQQVSLSGLLANLVAIPVVGFIIVPLNLAAAALVALAPSLAAPLLLTAGWVLTALMALLESMSQLPVAVVTRGAPSGWGLGLAVAGAGIVLAPRGWPHRWLGVLLLLPLGLQPRGGPACGEAWLWALDVGMGAATLVETCRHALVFDTGPRWSARFDAGRAIVLPILRERGIAEPDRLIVSHGDRDHSGGTQALLDAFPGTALWSGTPEQFPGHSVSGCRAGQSWRWDGVDFQLLHPADEGGNDNDRSCVLRIAARGASALLTGDIEARSERALLRRRPRALDVDVLVVPHHGSSSSSTPEFVNAVDADFVLFSVGYLNRWRLPAPGVLDRYERDGALILRTDRDGAVRIGLGPEGVEAPWRARREMRAYWRRPLQEH